MVVKCWQISLSLVLGKCSRSIWAFRGWSGAHLDIQGILMCIFGSWDADLNVLI
jgi:hypothetical protein